VLRRVAELYKIEDDLHGPTHEKRRAVRQAKSRPLIDSLAPWLTEQLSLISQKNKLAEAIVAPLAYLADVIIEIVNCHPNSQLDDLLQAYADKPETKPVV
jgi:hypothetical protein